MSRPLVDNDFKAYKGVTTDIDFIVANNDRKPVTLAGKNVYVIIRDDSTKQEMLKKPLKLLDASKGKLQLSLSPAEINDWDEGFYDYVIFQENNDGSQNALFTSQDQDASGWFEVKGGIFPSISRSYELLPENFTPFHFGEYPGGVTRYASDSVVGDAHLGLNDGLHTFAVYLNDFTGRLWAEGSLEDCVPTEETDWFVISLTPNTFELHFYGASGIEPFNFNANLSWVRFVYEEDTLNTGEITRILYKP